MTAFGPAVTYVIDNEVGYSDHPSDYGGKTKHGITEKALRDHLRTHVGCQIRARRPLDLTSIDILHIYELDYWHPRFAEISGSRVTAKLLDFCVMRGRDGGVEILQMAVNGIAPFVELLALQLAVGPAPAPLPQISVDGVFGPKTLAAVNSLPEIPLLLSMWREISLHHGRVTRDSTKEGRRDQRPFIAGWLARCFKIPAAGG